MDSPSLRSYDYEQFWEEQKRTFKLSFEPEILPVSPFSQTEEATPITVKMEEKESLPSPKPKKRVRTKKTEQDSSKDGFSQNKENSDEYKATKNLTINYGRAIISFACSNLAMPYLDHILTHEGLTYKVYSAYTNSCKNQVKNIESFRSIFMMSEDDPSEEQACKRAFQAIAIVFIKYFSVNWIMNGKLSNKLVYLKWRFRLLRRIQSPETFTYLKFQPKKEKQKRRRGRKINLATNSENQINLKNI